MTDAQQQQKVDINVPDNAVELAKRLSNVLQLLINYGMSEKADEKQWVLDQIARSVLAENYSMLTNAYNATHEQKWDKGIKPEVVSDGKVTFYES